MKYKFRIYTQHEFEVFSPDALQGNIGKEIPVTLGTANTPATIGVVLDVSVAENGCWADLLMEIPDDSEVAKMMKEKT